MNLKILLFAVLIVCASKLMAQRDLILYSLPGVAQSLYVNPSRAPHKAVHIGLPFMSSVSLHHRNTLFNPGRLFKNTEGRTEFQTQEFLDEIRDKNALGVDMSIDIFSLGIPVKNHYFSLAVREKVTSELSLPGDLLRFPFIGNGDFDATGGSLDFSGLGVELNHYVEYGFGWQTMIKDKFSFGARAKMLFGKENIRTRVDNLNWNTDPLTYEWTYSGDMEVNTSGMSILLDSIDGNSLLENGEVVQYMMSSPNSGLGIDLGFGLQLNERWDMSLSLIDLGYIKWKENNRNYSGVGHDFTFAGIEVTEAFFSENASFEDSLDAAIEAIGESLEDSFSTDENTSEYTSALKTRIYGSLGYRVFQKAKSSGKATFLINSDFQDGMSFPSMSLIYAHSFTEKASFSVSYSAIDRDFMNLGFGFSIKGGPLVFYTTMDNFLWTTMDKVNLSEGRETITYPSFSRNATLHFGLNLTLGKKSDINKKSNTDEAHPILD